MKTFILLLATSLLTFSGITADDKNANPTNAAVQSISQGTITEYTPGTTFVVREAAGPIVYIQGEKVTYVTKSGTVLTEADVKSRIKVGTPVTVHYGTHGETRIVNRVVLGED